ncbi:MAG: permease-like cell division protein FtsX [Clostridiales bacterium]|nr:permease-like cell division protein FtsX [Clostridiales bacterium]
MSVRAFFNSIKEGFIGIIRHPLVTVASITTILLMLVVMSAFFIFATNARSMMRKLGQRPPIEVYMVMNCEQEQLDAVSAALNADPRILSWAMHTPEDNYNEFKSNLGDRSSLLDDIDYDQVLPYTFSIQLKDPRDAESVVSAIQINDGVSKVATESKVMDFLTKATNVVNIATVVSFVVLFMISLFIISNMVRISVYSRASEIEIMKFVGATNGYIRMPYITEGAIVGLLSALIAWVITVLCYKTIYEKMMHSIDPSSFYALLSTRSLMWTLLIMVVVFGVFIGAIGSGISVRKYIKV